MGIWYVQTWTVAKGKTQEHDELSKRRFEFSEGKIDKKVKAFNAQQGPIGGRIIIIQFDSYADYEQHFEKRAQDAEWMKLTQEWLTLIDPNTFKVFFWQETERSLNW